MLSEEDSGEDYWRGAFYELNLYVAPQTEQVIEAALSALWRFPDLDGCVNDNPEGPQGQRRLAPEVLPPEGEDARRFGAATLPDGRPVACGTLVFRDQPLRPGLRCGQVCFHIPVAALEAAYPASGAGWALFDRRPVDAWLCALGRFVHARAPFELAVIGHEDAAPDLPGLHASGVPESRAYGLLWPRRGGHDEVIWHPPTVEE